MRETRTALLEWLWFKGDYRGALEMARDTRSLHEELGVRRYQAHDWLVEGMAFASLGHVREAVTLLSDSVELADQLDHPEWWRMRSFHWALFIDRCGGCAKPVRRSLAADLGDQIGAGLWAQLGCVGLGFTALLERKVDEAELSFGTVLSAPEELQDPRAGAMTGMGSLELERGNLHLAHDWSCSAIEISEAAPYMDALLEAQLLRARTLLALGKPDDAWALLTQVHGHARAIGARPMEAQARRALVEMKIEKLRAQGEQLGTDEVTSRPTLHSDF